MQQGSATTYRSLATLGSSRPVTLGPRAEVPVRYLTR